MGAVPNDESGVAESFTDDLDHVRRRHAREAAEVEPLALVELGGHDARAHDLDPDAGALELGTQGLRHRDEVGEGAGVDGPPGELLRRRRPAERDPPGDVDDGASAPLEHPADDGPHQQGGDDLHVDELGCLVGGEVGQRHVVGDASVVDEHRQRFGGAQVGDGRDAGGG